MASKSKLRRRGYDEGGSVQPAGSVGQGIANSMRGGLLMAQLAKMYGGAGGAAGALGGGAGVGAARGGPIKRVAGKPIGKDDGLIPAQKGEYVVRKSAVNKLGTKALNTINKGKLPAGRGR